MKEIILDRRGHFPRKTNIREDIKLVWLSKNMPNFYEIFHSRQECLKCFHLSKNRFKDQLEARCSDKLC